MNASSVGRAAIKHVDLSSPSSLSLLNRPEDAPRGSQRLRAFGVAADATALCIAAFVAFATQLGSVRNVAASTRVTSVALFVVVTIGSIAANKLYRARVCSVRALEIATLLRANVIALVVMAALRNKLMPEQRVRHLMWAQLMAFVGVLIARSLYRKVLERARRAGRFMRAVVVVGTGDEGFEMLRLLQDEPELGYDVRGVVGDRGSYDRLNFTVPYLGNTDVVVEAVKHSGATGAILGVSALDFRELNRVVRALLTARIHVQVSGGLVGIAAGRLRSNPIGREAAFYLEQVSLTGWQSSVKRVIDVLLGSILIIPALPIMAVLALIVRRTDRGPALFKQQRIGLDGQPFTILKMRTMVVDAEARLAELMRQNERTGPLFKLERDPRLTPIGRFMDATSLNELPQLFNVIRGDMSLVGPRPALAREVSEFDERLMMRHLVRPGITGLWQVESRDSPSFSDYERCDVFYVENWSVQLDVAILFETIGTVVDRALSVLRRKPLQVIAHTGSPDLDSADPAPSCALPDAALEVPMVVDDKSLELATTDSS